jgi:hypothetical protein
MKRALLRRLTKHVTAFFTRAVFFVGSFIFVAIAAQPAERGAIVLWDWLLITGVLLLATGIILADRVPEKLALALARLVGRNAIDARGDTLRSIQAKLEKKAQRWSQWSGVIVAASILAAFAVAGSASRIPLAAFEAAWGYIAGSHLGRMAAYGGLGSFLKQHGLSIRVTPGHLDGAAGLKPVGDLFFLQSIIVAIPAIYLAVWSVLIPYWPRTSYLDWKEPYIALLALSIVFEVLAFVLPMWSFHIQMVQLKRGLLYEADRLSVGIASLERELAEQHAGEERDGLRERLAQMTKQYWNIENMPTWPVSLRTKRVFTAGNAVLVLPLLSDLLGPWGTILDIIRRLFNSP